MQSSQAVDNIIDEVWSRTLSKIIKGRETGPMRTSLGDDIDLVIPQAAVAVLLSQNPAFAKVLYRSAYTSAKRNGYITTRQLGMPPDFFWEFDYWTQQRAQETMQKVMARVFASLMIKQKEGNLELVKVDVEHGRFEMVFGNCAECAGLTTPNPICFFHAGLFAGILGALLDRDMDAVEMECMSNGGKTCGFRIGKPEDREIKMPFDERLGHISLQVDFSTRVTSQGQHAVRELGNLVDVGYYQLLLSSVFLGQLEVLSGACLAAGDELGRALASAAPQRFQGDASAAISALCSDLKYTNVRLSQSDQGVEVHVEEAPENLGPMAQATLVPFLAGWLQGLLSSSLGKSLHFQSAQREGNALLLRFSP